MLRYCFKFGERKYFLLPHSEAEFNDLIEIPNENNKELQSQNGKFFIMGCEKNKKHLNKSYFQKVHFLNQKKV